MKGCTQMTTLFTVYSNSVWPSLLNLTTATSLSFLFFFFFFFPSPTKLNV